MSLFHCNFAHMKTKHCKLERLSHKDMAEEPHVEGTGGMILCEAGSCTLHINFTKVTIHAMETVTLYPTDIIVSTEASDDFSARAFLYDEATLREASIHIEETVFSALRNDRICRDKEIVKDVIYPVFTILSHFFSMEECDVADEIAVAQLRSLFLGFNDYIIRNVATQRQHYESQRTEELFTKFMHDLEHNYKESRDVQYYADRLFITRKYLGIIVNRKTGRTPKQLIDEYVVMQLKLSLRNTNGSIRQIASAYHFSDDSLLIRYFRSHTGMTPIQYRRS